MKRMKNHEFNELLDKIRNADAEEKASILYWAGLALNRRRYGSFVYVHANAPRSPSLLMRHIGRWGKSNNTNHSDVTVWVSGYAAFGTERLWKIIKATGT